MLHFVFNYPNTACKKRYFFFAMKQKLHYAFLKEVIVKREKL